MSTQNTAHITAQTALKPSINGWEMYLGDQGRSPHTVKAFLGDLNLLVSFLPPDRTIVMTLATMFINTVHSRFVSKLLVNLSITIVVLVITQFNHFA